MAGPPPPTPVSVAVAAEETVPVELRAVGTVQPSVTVQVRSQIAGELMSVHFTEGSEVNQGDLLFEIDKRPYEEALLQAEATLARDTAQLHQYEANLARDRAQAKSTDADAARNTQLAKEGIMSQSAGELARANSDALHESIKADQAAIESSRAAIESDKSGIDGARLNLNYCEIRAPISGRTGNLLVQQGNIIKVSDVALVVINKLSPIFVAFGIPQQHLPEIRANNSKHPLTVMVSLQGDASKSTRGALSVIDNAVEHYHRDHLPQSDLRQFRTPSLARPICERRSYHQHQKRHRGSVGSRAGRSPRTNDLCREAGPIGGTSPRNRWPGIRA